MEHHDVNYEDMRDTVNAWKRVFGPLAEKVAGWDIDRASEYVASLTEISNQLEDRKSDTATLLETYRGLEQGANAFQTLQETIRRELHEAEQLLGIGPRASVLEELRQLRRFIPEGNICAAVCRLITMGDRERERERYKEEIAALRKQLEPNKYTPREVGTDEQWGEDV